MDKIFVDASEKAEIIFGDGTPSISPPTLQEAIIAFTGLDEHQKTSASIKTKSGVRFGPDEIGRLHYR